LAISFSMKIAVYSLVFLCCAAGAGAQDQDFTSIRRQPYVQLNYHSGTFWSRTEYLQEAFEDPYRAVEFRLGLQSTGKRLWEQIHKYPKYGIGVHYSDLIMDPSDTTMGNPFSLFLFYSAPWARWGKFTLAADLSTGLSYMDRIHHPVHNPFNDVVASHINLYLDLKVNLGYSLSQRMDLYAGYGLTHYSNGRIHQPQKGVNNWGWTAGVSYLFQDRMENFFHRQTPEFHASESLEFMLAVGVVEEIPMGTEIQISYFTSSFTADYVYQFNPKAWRSPWDWTCCTMPRWASGSRGLLPMR
jgi:opacity protein-like surface antigen